METANAVKELAVCENCCTVWNVTFLKEPQDLSMRLAPGDTYPSGECPLEDCGALCLPAEPNEQESDISKVIDIWTDGRVEFDLQNTAPHHEDGWGDFEDVDSHIELYEKSLAAMGVRGAVVSFVYQASDDSEFVVWRNHASDATGPYFVLPTPCTYQDEGVLPFATALLDKVRRIKEDRA